MQHYQTLKSEPNDYFWLFIRTIISCTSKTVRFLLQIVPISTLFTRLNPYRLLDFKLKKWVAGNKLGSDEDVMFDTNAYFEGVEQTCCT